jgi:hypothetical protein
MNDINNIFNGAFPDESRCKLKLSLDDRISQVSADGNFVTEKMLSALIKLITGTTVKNKTEVDIGSLDREAVSKFFLSNGTYKISQLDSEFDYIQANIDVEVYYGNIRLLPDELKSYIESGEIQSFFMRYKF